MLLPWNRNIGCRSSDVHGEISIFSDFRSLVLLVMYLFGMLFKEYDFVIKIKSKAHSFQTQVYKLLV